MYEDRRSSSTRFTGGALPTICVYVEEDSELVWRLSLAIGVLRLRQILAHHRYSVEEIEMGEYCGLPPLQGIVLWRDAGKKQSIFPHRYESTVTFTSE